MDPGAPEAQELSSGLGCFGKGEEEERRAVAATESKGSAI